MTAKEQIREIQIMVMMELGEFDPHTREEAERRLDDHYAECREKSIMEFDPGI